MGKDVAYLKKDLKRYTKLNREIKKSEYSVRLLNVKYETPMIENIEIPNMLFSNILTKKRPDLIKHTINFKIIVKELIRGDNPWLKKTKKLGIYDEKTGVLELFLDLNEKMRVLPFLWLLLHEFRHHVQFNNPNVLSCLDNKNRERWLNHYNYTLDSVKHVFHEIDPLEIDANTFACEILDIPYPSSKFSITKKTLKRLVLKEKTSKCSKCEVEVPFAMTIDNWCIHNKKKYCMSCQEKLKIGFYDHADEKIKI